MSAESLASLRAECSAFNGAHGVGSRVVYCGPRSGGVPRPATVAGRAFVFKGLTAVVALAEFESFVSLVWLGEGAKGGGGE